MVFALYGFAKNSPLSAKLIAIFTILFLTFGTRHAHGLSSESQSQTPSKVAANFGGAFGPANLEPTHQETARCSSPRKRRTLTGASVSITEPVLLPDSDGFFQFGGEYERTF